MEQALQLAPAWPAGWSRLAEYAEKAGLLDTAVGAWRRLLGLDPAGVFGARLKLAVHGAAEAVHNTDTAYVEALFDDYATRFDAALLQRLDYVVPAELGRRVAEQLRSAGLEQVAHAIDLGCGTGLMGERLRRLASHLEGVDLSAGMLDECRRKGVYDRLTHGELVAFLDSHAGGVDLVTASDVFNYCGALEPGLAAANRVLSPGGVLAFSIEAHEGPEAVVLRPSLRFAHEVGATRAALGATGFEIINCDSIVLRRDRGLPVPGYLLLARRRPAAAHAGQAAKYSCSERTVRLPSR